MKMPESRSGVDLLPNVADAWNRRFEQGQLFNFVWVLRSVRVSDHQSNVVPDQIDLLIAKTFHECVNIISHRLLIVTSGRTRRLAEAAQIRINDRVIFAELVKERNPHVRGITETVNEDERVFSRPGFPAMNLNAI